jgi:aspartate/tyrosine/aromatic aminotransferase
MRKALRSELEAMGARGTWEHVTSQIGMFSYLGLSELECERLIKEHHIYLVKAGARISVAGINTGNVKYIAKAIKEVTTSS